MTGVMLKEAIVLAGGLGTRLRSAVPDLPKCMAPVGGKPFIAYLTDHFRRSGVERFIFALGYKSAAFDDFFRRYFPDGGYTVSVEEQPLGTGGAIRRACTLARDRTVLILNGDTFFGIRTAELAAAHEKHGADCTICLKPMRQFDRFGAVELDPEDRVRAFREKKYTSEGAVNGGVYALNREGFLAEPLPEVFSFEKDYLERSIDSRRIYGLLQDAYFIDIGIPEDYRKVQQEINSLQ